MSSPSMRRLRQLATRLNETIADSPELNAEIERRLDHLPNHLRTPVLDALDVLKQAGEAGLIVGDWASRVRDIYSDPEMSMANILGTTVRQFPIVVRKLGDKHYGWAVLKSVNDDSIDGGDTIASQVELTTLLFQIMREMGQFTVTGLKRHLAAKSHMQPQIISHFVDHVMTQFSSMLQRNGEYYSVKSEEPLTRDANIQALRDLTRRPAP